MATAAEAPMICRDFPGADGTACFDRSVAASVRVSNVGTLKWMVYVCVYIYIHMHIYIYICRCICTYK